ncbi:GNAT family N-acetyltransferase [Vibrio sp. FF145]|uniref:GNAT family N-acetyltransferase n=1 Tax=Vibrio sp. FF145 TaxID=3230013 RepID=UPI00352D1D35
MKKEIAEQISNLLNEENQLVVNYTANKILESKENYIYEEENGVVKGFLECKKVQWYQTEVCHLTVKKDFRGKGLSTLLINKALDHSVTNLNARIIQCTIREGNEASEGAFNKAEFAKVASFYYPISGNNVGVWQKVVSLRA